MITPPIPENETERLAALRRYRVLDTAPEEAFDRLTRLAATMLRSPIALISLVDDARQWFKSRQGLDVTETPREWAFCAHSILSSDTMVVGDALTDTRFVDNPLVNGRPYIRFYAGAPLVTPDGFRLGTLCVIDRVPRPGLDATQTRVLEDLAALAVEQLELRQTTREALDDVVKREHSEAELRDAVVQRDTATRDRDRLMTTMAHELRSPLCAILGYAELIASSTGSEAKAQAAGIDSAATHMLELVDNLLEQAKLEAGDLTIEDETLPLADIAREVCALMDVHAERLGISLVDCVRATTVHVRVDRLRFRQILANLVGNAIKFTPPGGRVELNSERRGDGSAALTVSDTGVGIAPEDRDVVLEPFGRSGSSPHPGEHSTGLGLPISRGLIELHGGTLKIDSTLGGGTKVTVTLPPDRVLSAP